MHSTSSWNRIPNLTPKDIFLIQDRDFCLPDNLKKPFITYGNGRSYSDVCLTQKGTLIRTNQLNKFISFDYHKGTIKCEAGVTLGEVLSLIVPHGWFLASTPGTQYVTIGGAIANDVHGKNHHHEGSFGNHLISLEIQRSNGEKLVCSSHTNSGLFSATVGGLGLTGIITWAEIKLKRIQNTYIWTEQEAFNNLNEYWHLSKSSEKEWPYTVAWLDCLSTGKNQGRGILFKGRHAATQNHAPSLKNSLLTNPIDPPFSFINTTSVRIFNSLYFHKNKLKKGHLCHFQPFFYPLDGIKDWNKIYGNKGFYQYQCIIPPETAQDSIQELLKLITKSKQGSFLAVLKTFGEIPPLGLISFPRRGTTLALDFPNKGNKTLQLFEELDKIVLHSDGALYPAKDARMTANLFRASFPSWEKFSHFIDPAFSSNFWERISE